MFISLTSPPLAQRLNKYLASALNRVRGISDMASDGGKKFARRDRLREIEVKVQQWWEEKQVFKSEPGDKPPEPGQKFFGNFPFPYMNGYLHLGHAFSLSKLEFAAAFHRLRGANVLLPFAFHCTGMPIKASADKLAREIQQFGNPPVFPEEVVEELESVAIVESVGDENGAPAKFKGKKSKVAAKSSGQAYQWEILRSVGISDAEISEFQDPYKWLSYFPPLAIEDLKAFGLGCDWRRSFITTDMNPYFDSFVRWQMRKLKSLGKVVKDVRYTIFSPLDGQPCADHDRASGEGVQPQEYTIIKMELVSPFPEKFKVLEGKKVYLAAATLRPETMYGQTNAWVLPDGKYGAFEINETEVFVTARRAALNLAYQNHSRVPQKPTCLLELTGHDLIGLPLKSPLSFNEIIYALPMLSILMDKGTGVVTSVPSDAPDDYMALHDLKSKPAFRAKYGVKDEWVLPFEIVPIIDVPPFGNKCAETVCLQMKIKSQNEKDKLAEAKKQTYLKGFTDGTMIVGEFSGKKVQEVKPLIRSRLLETGQAIIYSEPEKRVMSRSGDECVVALTDQWYITYGESEWKKLADECLSNMSLYSEETRHGFEHTLGWLNQWACSRSFGLGTRIPWDEQFLVESLSDSTIYMAYYTIAHYLQEGDMYGSSESSIKPQQLTDDVWDYIFCDGPLPKSTDISSSVLERMKLEFEYWYPFDLRVSGKDLIQNHLTFCIYNHTAIFPKHYWPRGFRCNGHTMLNSEKMSKSTGNFRTIRQAIEEFSADATRFSLADAGDGVDDANFVFETANAAILKLTKELAWYESILPAESSLRTGPPSIYADRVFANEINIAVRTTEQNYSNYMFRDALKTGFYDLQAARDEYILSCGVGGLNRDLVWRFMDVQTRLLAPICPHYAEFIWRDILKKDGFVVKAGWPTADAPDLTLKSANKYLQDSIVLIRKLLQKQLSVNMGRFSVQEYSKFRIIPINEAAVALAESGKIGALNLLFKRHPYSLSPFVLDVLASIPETVPVQIYGQLLPGRSFPSGVAVRQDDWVECKKTVDFINTPVKNHGIQIQVKTEPLVKHFVGLLWPSIDELSKWYMDRARAMDAFSGQLDNCLSLLEFALRKGISELQQFHQDVLYLHQVIYSDDNDSEAGLHMSLVKWEELPDYERFKFMLRGVKEESVTERLHNRAIPFMREKFHRVSLFGDGTHCTNQSIEESFLVRWLKEIALQNKLDMCLVVIEEGCRNFQSNVYFETEVEAVDCALQCIYLCTVTDRWSIMAAILSKLPQMHDGAIQAESLERRLRVAESHIEAGRLLAFYQVPKPLNFFLGAQSDEKGVKQIIRLILSKFIRRQPGRSDSEWASMWRDMQYLREKTFPFLDLEYILIEFCRGLLKAGKFSLARNYLKGTSSVSLASEKAENLVIQAAREYFFSASSISCSEVWKAKECLNLYPSSANVKAEADIIDALTVKLPNLGVNILPMQFRQIKDPMEIVKMAITNPTGAYFHVEELVEVARLLGLRSADDVSAVEEAIAREAAVSGDLQLASDLCLVLARKGHGNIWDLCAAIARGPALENMEVDSRKQLLGFALSHCDEESIGELLHAWKDLDMQGQCETLIMSTGTNPSKFSVQGSTVESIQKQSFQNILDRNVRFQEFDGYSSDNQDAHLEKIREKLSIVAKTLAVGNQTDWASGLTENGKVLSFAALQLPWLIELSKNGYPSEKLSTRKQYLNIKAQAVVTILSWLARNGFAPRDNLIASLARSVMEPPVTEDEDIIGCSYLLNLADAFNGVEVIEEQLKIRKDYQEICSIMNVGMAYSLLHNSGVGSDHIQRKQLLKRRFKEKHTTPSSDDIDKLGKVQSSFWREWKLKLEEQKRFAEHSRALQKIIPGVETERFLSRDSIYIENVVISLIESVKLEKRHILKDILRLADTYDLNSTEVLLHFLSAVLVSDVWTNDEITAEVAGYKGEIIGNGVKTIETISTKVYPAINGCNKLRLAYVFGLLSECYLQLENTKDLSPIAQPDHTNGNIRFAHYYKVVEQECKNVSFINNLNFKNIAGLRGLNFECFSDEVYACIEESSLSALSKMIQAFVDIYGHSLPEGFMSWQDVYKYYILSSLSALEAKATTDFSSRTPECIQNFLSKLEQSYDSCRKYIRLLSQSDALTIMKQYLTVIVPLHSSYGFLPDNSTWQECLIVLLNFWVGLTDDMKEFSLEENSGETNSFNPQCLTSCLKVFMKLVMEDIISPSQGWSSIYSYVNCGLNGDCSVEIYNFSKAMVFSGCGFGAISEVFSVASLETGSSSDCGTGSQDLAHFYLDILEAVLQELVNGSHESQKLYHILSSLSKLEGDLKVLQCVRHVIWGEMVQFSDNLQLPSSIRVYVLELMQFISGKNIKGFSTEIQANVQPWEEWDELLYASRKSEAGVDKQSPDHKETSSRFTNTLVALKSSQLVTSISPSIEITPDDLLNVDTAVSCFLRLCGEATENLHFDALVSILEEWEGLFTMGKDREITTEASDGGNDWNNDDWDEGWESLEEVDKPEKEKIEDSVSVHPLHVCWAEILKKFIGLSRSSDVLRMIDQSSSKPNGMLLDEDDARSLNEIALSTDCFLALKMALMLPYKTLQLQCLSAVEDSIKQGVPHTRSNDCELLIIILSSGILTSIATGSTYGTTFSYLCYMVGNLSNQVQQALISSRGFTNNEDHENQFFQRILFPNFISELVKADQHVLAGFIVTKFMHTSESLSLINIANASLNRYLERQLHMLQTNEFHVEMECKTLRNTVSRLRGRLSNLIQSTLPLLSANVS